MLVFTLLTAATPAGSAAKMTLTLRRTRSLTTSGINSGLKLVVFDRDVFTLYITRFSQTSLKRGNIVRVRLGRRGVDKSDYRQRRLLSTRS
jgi:hypothetical protein